MLHSEFAHHWPDAVVMYEGATLLLCVARTGYIALAVWSVAGNELDP